MKDINKNESGLKQSPELEAKKSDEQKKQETLNFYKIAFCVDGEVKLISPMENFKIRAVVELNDSKRGKFYIGILEKKEFKK